MLTVVVVPDTLAELNQEATAAQAEASRAAARIGVPWDRAEEVAGLRRRQKEIEESLAATAEPQTQKAAAPRPGSAPVEPGAPRIPRGAARSSSAAGRLAARLDALEHRASQEPRNVGI